jgi:hydrogenase maturation protein HypF
VADAVRIRVTGVVQGVGFRPFVWRLANELELAGWVRNDAAGVEIHAEGNALDAFVARLKSEAPPLARVDAVSMAAVAPTGCAGFLIAESGGGRVTTAIGHDTATCPDCLAELFDPRNRRYRHAFITCTHCGPRYTVTRRLPYDRPQTSLAPFPLCPDCAREYADPADRRFHAETTCCPNCGPRLELHGAAGEPIATTLELLKAGKIVAIKGLGGFHLACDATNAAAVATLRERKQREEKPFAVMVAEVAAAERFAKVGAGGTAQAGSAALMGTALVSPERPVVLLEKRDDTDARLPGVAPGLAEIGLMLPATPIQFLLFHDAPELALVMTSANPHGEPLVICNEEALQRLAGIADAYLLHDRDIVVRCDDSVRRPDIFVRRARGYVPRAIKLATSGPSVLAVGGWFKNNVCVSRGDEAFVSQHVGDLDNAAACGFFEETVAHLLHILDVAPEIVAHDLHPDFHSTRYAASCAAERGIPAIGVQHHHAHIAAVCAEHGIVEPVLGLALDGVGLGDDGSAWGGELLRVDGATFERLAHLAPLLLPGGDIAAREPWRMAAAALHALGRGDEVVQRFAAESAAATVAAMLARGLNCPPTSSAGRLFDAAAGLLAVSRRATFEGQAAMRLEGLAARHGVVPPLAGGWRVENGALDFRPLLAALAEAREPAAAAALFHATLAAGLVDWVARTAQRTGIGTVAAAGGCLLNRLLARGLREGFAARGLRFVTAERLPPNDGGLALGQAWAVMRRDVTGARA